MRRVLPILLLLAAAAAAAVLANVALLGTATSGSDPVGKLRPRANLPPPPAGVVRPSTGPVEQGGESDD
jgi:hypothetical protein